MSPDFHELWRSHNDSPSLLQDLWQGLNHCLSFTVVTLVLGWVTTSVHYSCSDGFVLALVDRNPIRPHYHNIAFNSLYMLNGCA